MPLSTDPWPKNGSRAVVFNTEAAWFFLESESYRSDVWDATDVYCDGAGLAAYAKARFHKPVSRRHGPDVMRTYLENARGRTILLFGGSDSAHSGLKLRFPRFFACNSVESDTRMMAPEDYAVVAAEVASHQYDDVLIFLGLLRQERFQALLHQAGHVGASIGLGAAIDFLSGSKPRSGRLWQAVGLEWLPRLLREPRMLPRVGRSFAIFPRWFDPCNQELEAFLFDGPKSAQKSA